MNVRTVVAFLRLPVSSATLPVRRNLVWCCAVVSYRSRSLGSCAAAQSPAPRRAG